MKHAERTLRIGIAKIAEVVDVLPDGKCRQDLREKLDGLRRMIVRVACVEHDVERAHEIARSPVYQGPCRHGATCCGPCFRQRLRERPS